MDLFKNIRLRIASSMLKKKSGRLNRKVNYSSFSLVRKIGIVWDASNPEDFIALSKFHQKMSERNIAVNILGYYPGKELPDKYTAIRYLNCIRKMELSFFYIPVSPETNEFINNHFEILIDLNFKNLFPLQYITSLSNAGLKVGLFDKNITDSQFDLMMEIKNPVNIDNYLNQILVYLEMINSGNGKKVS